MYVNKDINHSACVNCMSSLFFFQSNSKQDTQNQTGLEKKKKIHLLSADVLKSKQTFSSFT